MSEINMEMAKSVYDTVCVALDKMNINYNKHEEDLVITFGHKGRDMNHNLLVYENKMLHQRMNLLKKILKICGPKQRL